MHGFPHCLGGLPWAPSRTWLWLGDPVEQTLGILGKSLPISYRSLTRVNYSSQEDWAVFLGCCHHPQWLSLHCGKKYVLLMTGLLIIFRTTFSSRCWYISKKSSRTDGRFCISHWGCVFKLLEFESQGKCVLSQVILLADFPGTSKATVGLGIHSLVYGFVFFHPTSLAGWTGLGPTLGSCCSSQLAPSSSLWAWPQTGKPRGWAHFIHNLRWQPQQGALALLGPLYYLATRSI